MNFFPVNHIFHCRCNDPGNVRNTTEVIVHDGYNGDNDDEDDYLDDDDVCDDGAEVNDGGCYVIVDDDDECFETDDVER